MIISKEVKSIYDRGFHLEETATICMFALLDALILLFAQPLKVIELFVLNLCFIASVMAVRAIDLRARNAWMTIFRDWYPLALLIMIYMEHFTLIPLINPHDIDDLLIALDRFLFAGHDPTVLMERFTRPVFTEILQIVYASYYFLPAILCFWLYLRKDKSVFHASAATLLIGFYVSYAGYYLFPAIGPRFTLQHLQSSPLEGLFSFHFLRNLLDQMEGVTRDCFPSGHALISVLTVLLSRRYLKPYAITAWIWMILLVVSTVYLRYHYIVDVIAGIALSFAVYGLVPAIERYLQKAENSPSPRAADTAEPDDATPA